MSALPPPFRPLRIALADDHPIVTIGLRDILTTTAQLHVVHVSHSGTELIAQLRAKPCEVIVTDFSMSGDDNDGLYLVRTLHRGWPSAKIIVYTALYHSALAHQAVRVGAAAVISKEDSLDELLAAIRQPSLPDAPYVSPRLRGDASLASPHFTPRELEVLRYVGLGMSVMEISRKMSVSISTVSTHKRNVMNKLKIASNVELIQYIHESGLANLHWDGTAHARV